MGDVPATSLNFTQHTVPYCTQPPLITTSPFNVHKQKPTMLSVTSQMGQKATLGMKTNRLNGFWPLRQIKFNSIR